jgi:hypothetical protein
MGSETRLGLGPGTENTVMARYRKRDERRKTVILGSPDGRHPLLTHPENSGCLVFASPGICFGGPAMGTGGRVMWGGDLAGEARHRLPPLERSGAVLAERS